MTTQKQTTAKKTRQTKTQKAQAAMTPEEKAQREQFKAAPDKHPIKNVPGTYPHGEGYVRPSYLVASFIALGLIQADISKGIKAKGKATLTDARPVLQPIERAWVNSGRLKKNKFDSTVEIAEPGLRELEERQAKGKHVAEYVAEFLKAFEKGGTVKAGAYSGVFRPVK